MVYYQQQQILDNQSVYPETVATTQVLVDINSTDTGGSQTQPYSDVSCQVTMSVFHQINLVHIICLVASEE